MIQKICENVFFLITLKVPKTFDYIKTLGIFNDSKNSNFHFIYK